MTSVRKAVSVCSLLSVICVACSDPPIAPERAPLPERLRIDGCGGTCSVEIGSEQELSAIVLLPNGSTERRETVWTSASPEIATVDAGGRVRGVRTGWAAIQATVGSLTAAIGVRVQGRLVGSWAGQFVVRGCTVTDQFPQFWCDGTFYPANARHIFELELREEDGRFSGTVVITTSANALSVDEGGSLDADGRLRLSARGDPWNGWNGDVLATIDPLNARIRGDAVEGSFIMTIISLASRPIPGSVIVEADLENVRRR